MPDKNTVWLEKDNDGETIIIHYTIRDVPVAPIIAHQDNIYCNSFDNDFKEKVKGLKAGGKSFHVFPIPVLFEIYRRNVWRVVRQTEEG